MSVVQYLAISMCRLRVTGVAKTLLQRGHGLFSGCFVPEVIGASQNSCGGSTCTNNWGSCIQFVEIKTALSFNLEVSCMYTPKFQTARRYYNHPFQTKTCFLIRKRRRRTSTKTEHAKRAKPQMNLEPRSTISKWR